MESNNKPAKKPFYKTWWVILFLLPISGGILFLLPISVSILIWNKEKLDKKAKIGLIAALWFFVILFGSSDSSSSSSSSFNDGLEDSRHIVEENKMENEDSEPENIVEEQTEPPVSINTDQSLPPVKIEDKSEPTPSETVSQKNAVREAKAYLDYTAFSRDGLVEQLEYEQYSHDDSVYGADNSGADWYEQAAKNAEAYLDYSAFSRGGLIEQLQYEGFTQAQAEYGTDAVGL